MIQEHTLKNDRVIQWPRFHSEKKKSLILNNLWYNLCYYCLEKKKCLNKIKYFDKSASLF